MSKTLPPTSRSLPIALMRAREGVMSPIREMLSETDITEQQWRVLRVLTESGPIDSKSLAERASLLFPSLTRIVSSMNKNGFVTQTRDDTDRRKQIVEITEDGQRIIDMHSKEAADIVVGFKTRLGAEKYEQLLDLLEMLDPGRHD